MAAEREGSVAQEGKCGMIVYDAQHPMRPEDVQELIVSFLADNDVPMDVGVHALRQCLDLLHDVGRINALTRELGLGLSNLRSDEDLEVYCDVNRQGDPVGFIYKGWDDPGFGIGETIPIAPESMSLFMAQADSVRRMLAANGLSVTAKPVGDEGFWVDMTTVVYSEGLNAGALAAAIRTVADSADMLRRLVA